MKLKPLLMACGAVAARGGRLRLARRPAPLLAARRLSDDPRGA